MIKTKDLLWLIFALGIAFMTWVLLFKPEMVFAKENLPGPVNNISINDLAKQNLEANKERTAKGKKFPEINADKTITINCKTKDKK